MFLLLQYGISLLLLGAGYNIPTCESSLLQTLSFRQLGPYWRANTKGSSFNATTLAACAVKSLKIHHAYSFLYNKSTHICTTGTVPWEAPTLNTNGRGDVYVNRDINLVQCPFKKTIYFYESLCYRVIDVDHTYAEASEVCKTMGGFLASAKTSYKLACFPDWPSNYWAGADDISHDGKFFWKADGTLLDLSTILHTFVNPLQIRDQIKNCVMFVVGKAKFDIQDCQAKLPLLCEFNA